MTNVDLARWQFAFVTINHFFFVPVTIGLAFLTALLQTAWYRSKRDEYLRLTRFFGVLLVINVDDRRGHRPGAGVPVRHELGGVLAAGRQRFRGPPGDGRDWPRSSWNATFLGLWLFGWDRLSRRCTC